MFKVFTWLKSTKMKTGPRKVSVSFLWRLRFRKYFVKLSDHENSIVAFSPLEKVSDLTFLCKVDLGILKIKKLTYQYIYAKHIRNTFFFGVNAHDCWKHSWQENWRKNKLDVVFLQCIPHFLVTFDFWHKFPSNK